MLDARGATVGGQLARRHRDRKPVVTARAIGLHLRLPSPGLRVILYQLYRSRPASCAATTSSTSSPPPPSRRPPPEAGRRRKGGELGGRGRRGRRRRRGRGDGAGRRRRRSGAWMSTAYRVVTTAARTSAGGVTVALMSCSRRAGALAPPPVCTPIAMFGDSRVASDAPPATATEQRAPKPPRRLADGRADLAASLDFDRARQHAKRRRRISRHVAGVALVGEGGGGRSVDGASIPLAAPAMRTATAPPRATSSGETSAVAGEALRRPCSRSGVDAAGAGRGGAVGGGGGAPTTSGAAAASATESRRGSEHRSLARSVLRVATPRRRAARRSVVAPPPPTTRRRRQVRCRSRGLPSVLEDVDPALDCRQRRPARRRRRRRQRRRRRPPAPSWHTPGKGRCIFM